MRTASDGTIVSYDINADGCVTTRNRRYMSKVRNSHEEIESPENTGAVKQAIVQTKKSSGPSKMSNKRILCLTIYSIVCTASIVLTSYLLSIKCSIESTVNGDDSLVKNKSKYNILSGDLSGAGEGKCTTWH